MKGSPQRFVKIRGVTLSLRLLISHLPTTLAGTLNLRYVLSQIIPFFSSNLINKKFLKYCPLLILVPTGQLSVFILVFITNPLDTVFALIHSYKLSDPDYIRSKL